MDYRWKALLDIVSVAVLFVPTSVTVFVAARTQEQRTAARDKRLADFKKSPESRLLLLNEP